MTQDEFNRLHEGDMVQSQLSGQLYIVTANYGGRVTAVASADLTHPIEWDLVMKANYIRKSGEKDNESD